MIKLEWEYITIVFFSAFSSVVLWERGILNPIHALYALGGALFLLVVLLGRRFIYGSLKINGIYIPNMLLQLAIANLLLGLPPIIQGFAKQPLPSPLYIMLIGVIAEETYRIGAFHIFYDPTDVNWLSGFLAAIVFAAMHLYWNPTGWFYAIMGGLTLTILYIMYHSQLACIASHFSFNSLMFGVLTPFRYIALSFVLLTIGIALKMLDRGEVLKI